MHLPFVYTILNGIATVFIIAGFLFIKSGRRIPHIACMVTALTASAGFLALYLVYHYTAGHVPFAGTGAVRAVYFAILLTHIPLAVVNLPMIILTVIPALRKRFDRHKRLARWTLPVWLYVSVTGILVYLMLYVWFPSAPAPS